MNFKKRLLVGLSILITIIAVIGLITLTKEEKLFKNINTSINSKNIMNTVEELTSKKYNGRLIGTEGNQLATEYLVDHFKKINLKNPEKLKDYKQYYKQNVRATNSAPILSVLDKNGKIEKEYNYIEDFSVVTYNSLLSIKGKASGQGVLIEDVDKLSKSPETFRGKILLVSRETMGKYGLRNILLNIIEHKIEIKGIILEVEIEKEDKSGFAVAPNAPAVDNFSKNGPMLFTLESGAFKEISNLTKEGKNIYMTADYSIENVEGANVIGLLEGNHKELKEEFIIIGAHFDHVGDNKNGTYNPGALDNASGTATMMEIARILSENKIKPKKSILFIGFNGEEEGLYGSYNYANNPLYPLNDKTVMINLDMVGSKRKVPLESVSYDSSNTELRDELFKISKELGIDSRTNVSQGSDHVPFAAKGIKSVCLIHMDLESGYHTPHDTIDKVDRKRTEEAVKVVLSYLDNNAY
ncbi:M28 family metallopeptidase [Gottschalkia acidurici]|uniref:M28 family metallopeptidase n=1 Tax=Clostridium acidurici TaxID=1556 RepID=UPI000302AD18|nr:M28 family metallopeptidase [Gottschalkia acidurici]